MFVKKEGDNLQMEDIIQISNDLGVKSNKEKFQNWAVEQKYLGFIWNGVEKSVRLPEEKLKERIEKIEDLLTIEKKCSKKEIEKIVGQLSHMTYVIPEMKAYLWSLYRFDKSWYNLKATRYIPRDARLELEDWRQALSKFDRLRLEPIVDPTEIGWVGDASTGFGVGVLIGERWSRMKLSENWKTTNISQECQTRDIAWIETVAIRLGLLMVEKLFLTSKKRFIVYTDNTTTEAAIRNRKSKHKLVNKEWKLIQKELTRLDCDLKVLRVKSGNNKADGLSRGIRKKGEKDFEVRFEIPSDLKELMVRD